MPIFDFNRGYPFPDPRLAHPSGIVGFGGSLEPGRLLQAYRMGIFPWYSEGDPIIWWSPDPRMVLYPDEIKISHSMRKVLKDGYFRITFDICFRDVIRGCREQPRPGQNSTWITPEMTNAYTQLHDMGYAHSVEVWLDDRLAGGLYGVSLGSYFSGESMFSRVSNASKAGLIVLAKTLQKQGFAMIDCQTYTPHLASMGARHISRQQFLKELQACLTGRTLAGSWQQMKPVCYPFQD
ncbi:MAG: leucyl/phenylalanyl-tRNA--protein transferase [Chitinophagales bacterium]|nr:MAG: leucyl/phenylalanyl-tRNA--protein transferase [Chitinophagales bacterium]